MSTTLLQRLRAAGLRPTVARIGVLQAIDEPAAGAVCAEDVVRQMLRRGTPASPSTVYRVIHELDAAGLLQREWDHARKALYRVRPDGQDARSVSLVCRRSGRAVPLAADGELHALLLEAAARAGFDLRGQALTVLADKVLPAKGPSSRGRARFAASQ